MKVLNGRASLGIPLSPPGWRVYAIGFVVGLIVAAPELAAGQTDGAAASGVVAFFSLTVGLWLGIEISFLLLAAFAGYLESLRNRLDRLMFLLPAGMGGTNENAGSRERRKRLGLSKYMATIPLYVFPGVLCVGANYAFTTLLYSVGGLNFELALIVAASCASVAVCCLASMGIWCIVQEIRLTNITGWLDPSPTGDMRQHIPIDSAIIRVSKYLGYLTVRRV